MKIEKYTKKNGETAYRFRVYVGMVNGKRKYIKRFGFSTKSQARTALLQIQDDIDNPKTSKTVLFTEVSKVWLNDYYTTVQESTFIKTQRMLKNHILPALGHKTLEEITPLMLQELMIKWVRQLKNGRKHKGVINNILKYAIRYGYLATNPMDSVITPSVREHDEGDKDFYDKEQLRLFMDLVNESNDLKKMVCFRLLAFTGIRKGELLALDWKDWKDNTLTINKAVTRGLAGLEIGPTKTKSSKRLISLDQRTIGILKDYKKTTTGKGLLFQSEKGGIMTDSLPRKWLLQILDGKPLEPIKIHGFRHTHASLCFEAGMTLKQVQYRLGHSDLKTTMNVYVHITTQAKDDIAERFSSYIGF